MINIKNIERRRSIETYEYLSERLEYSPVSGQIFWKRIFPGRVAGTITKPRGGAKPYGKPYVKLSLERLDFKGHRIAWILFHKKPLPPGVVIDHINGDSTDNRIVNLRLCSGKNNSRNADTPKNNTTGFKGVSRCGKRFRAYITVDRRQIHLGVYQTPEEAFAAYVTAAKAHFGEFWSYG